MSLIFTMPGKIGDALHQWPIAYHASKQRREKITLWLEEKTLKPLVPLFEAQECVEKVELKPGITSWSCGGQPWDFGLTINDFAGHEVHHLGMRNFPQRQITLQCLEDSAFHLDADVIAREPSIFVKDPVPGNNRVVLHGNFLTHSSGTPGFWKFLSDTREWISESFTEATFVGRPAERVRALELYGPVNGCLWDGFEDNGNFYELARLIAGSKLVIGCGSCVTVLASLLKVPSVRVHDQIGGHPKVIWSNLGENQINETELELRKGAWARFRDRWVTAAEVHA